MKFIHHISITIPNPEKKIAIKIEGRNLLIVGDNGSGKTSLLNLIYQDLDERIIKHGIQQLQALEDTLKYCKNTAHSDPRDLQEVELKLQKYHNESQLHFNDGFRFEILFSDRQATITSFSPYRQADVSSSGLASRIIPQINNLNTNGNLSKNLEQHLVNLKVRAALDTYYLNNQNDSVKIENWFRSFTQSLRDLFEDETLELIFHPNELNILIKQQGKQPYSFAHLSSGFSSILNIYAHLIIQSEYARITPDELEGVALIDELDAHLHVSLQRKIFPFLTKSFPKIQFIVTTHSPFVLTSVDDALIYDIANNREYTDLSMYSLEAVSEGLLGVPPISKQFEHTLKKLIEITNPDEFNIVEAEKILDSISPKISVLDDESKMFYQLALNKILKAKSRDN